MLINRIDYNWDKNQVRPSWPMPGNSQEYNLTTDPVTYPDVFFSKEFKYSYFDLAHEINNFHQSWERSTPSCNPGGSVPDQDGCDDEGDAPAYWCNGMMSGPDADGHCTAQDSSGCDSFNNPFLLPASWTSPPGSTADPSIMVFRSQGSDLNIFYGTPLTDNRWGYDSSGAQSCDEVEDCFLPDACNFNPATTVPDNSLCWYMNDGSDEGDAHPCECDYEHLNCVGCMDASSISYGEIYAGGADCVPSGCNVACEVGNEGNHCCAYKAQIRMGELNLEDTECYGSAPCKTLEIEVYSPFTITSVQNLVIEGLDFTGAGVVSQTYWGLDWENGDITTGHIAKWEVASGQESSYGIAPGNRGTCNGSFQCEGVNVGAACTTNDDCVSFSRLMKLEFTAFESATTPVAIKTYDDGNDSYVNGEVGLDSYDPPLMIFSTLQPDIHSGGPYNYTVQHIDIHTNTIGVDCHLDPYGSLVSPEQLTPGSVTDDCSECINVHEDYTATGGQSWLSGSTYGCWYTTINPYTGTADGACAEANTCAGCDSIPDSGKTSDTCGDCKHPTNDADYVHVNITCSNVIISDGVTAESLCDSECPTDVSSYYEATCGSYTDYCGDNFICGAATDIVDGSGNCDSTEKASHYYNEYDAQNLCAKYKDELNIKIIKVRGPFYCKKCKKIKITLIN